MKTIMTKLALILTFFTSCGQAGIGDFGESGDSTETVPAKKISSRDYSIDQSNSYSNLFMDSTAVEKFIADKQLPDSIARRMRSFYNTRNYQYSWFSSDGLTEQARGFWNLHDYHTTYNHDTTLNDKKLLRRMDNLIVAENLSVSSSNQNFLNTELTLTLHFVKYIFNAFEKGYVKRKEMERFVPRKKADIMYLADSLLNKKHKDDKYFEDINEPYRLLKEQLAKYYSLTEKGGWQPIATETGKKKYKLGDSTSHVIALIKRRLQLTGEMPGNDTSKLFNDTLDQAVRTFQQRHGFKPDGIVTGALIKEMNIPAKKRLEQIYMNMERSRWMPSRPEGNLIVVNIPEFVLHLYEGKKKVWDMNVVVGKEGYNTMMFTGDLNQVVFSPAWHVPQSIVEEEILPAMQKDPDYLARQDMEVTGTVDDLPEIKQNPGPLNPLGKVKFLFPNSFNIYFHDTNAKGLFNNSKRAYSHGCIRLQEPEKMAEYLLRNQPEWTPEKIYEAMNSGKEKYVKLKDVVPVFISYFTAWVDESGMLNFREDIYDHDAHLASKMFTY